MTGCIMTLQLFIVDIPSRLGLKMERFMDILFSCHSLHRLRVNT